MTLGSKHRLSLRIALCAALVSGMVVAGSSVALAECETVWVEVYDVQLDVGRRTYHIGERARIGATVTRSDTGMPVEDALFVAYIPKSRKGWVFGFGKTDAGGEATAWLKLKKGSVELGPTRVNSVAYRESVDATCARLVEYGQKNLRKAFVVKR